VLGKRDSALDVGAHAGDVLAQIVAAAPKGRHHAFEPIPALAADLRARFPQVQVHEVALADTTGEATFHHVVTNPSYSGLKQRRFDREGEQVEVTTVRTARLDDLVPRQTPVRFVKIDVEGAEEGVLRGGLETIRANRPFIVFEHGLGGSEQYGTRPEALDELLGSVGLEISLMERWLAGQPPLTREELVRQFERAENYYFIASARV
jgi:FkbM family methyltransferase